VTNNKWYTWVALVFAIWFALTSWLWAWLLNIFLSYPFGLAALIIYFIGRKHAPGNKLNRAVLIILALGWLSSIVSALLIR
jgi:hypothetical protein